MTDGLYSSTVADILPHVDDEIQMALADLIPECQGMFACFCN